MNIKVAFFGAPVPFRYPPSVGSLEGRKICPRYSNPGSSRLPNRRIDVSKLYYDRKFGSAPPGTPIDLRYATILSDLALPARAQHDAFEDALGAAESYLVLEDMRERGVRLPRRNAPIAYGAAFRWPDHGGVIARVAGCPVDTAGCDAICPSCPECAARRAAETARKKDGAMGADRPFISQIAGVSRLRHARLTSP